MINRKLWVVSGIISSVCISACEKKNESNTKYNVLFIAVDDLRSELGCYGIEYIHSPNIDKLASEGRMFTNHFVYSAACGPSRSTLLSGIRTSSWDIFETIRESGTKPDSVFSLPQLFKENGYMTVAIGKVSHQPGGVMDSLQTIHEVPYSWNKSYAPVGVWKDPWKAFFAYDGAIAKEVGYGRPNDTYRHYPFEAADVSDNGYPDGLNADEAIKQLNKLKDTTFFLTVGFYKPHLPFNAPKKYWDLYDPDEIPEAEYNQAPQGIKSNICLHGENYSYEPRRYKWPDDSAQFEITADREKVLKHGYAACVSYIDAQIGKVLDELKKLGLEKNTIVVFWGDHGWHLGEYGIWGKHTNFDVALKSPLIIKTPEIKYPGIPAEGMIETVDIFPTLADLCNLPAPEYLEGISMMPILSDPREKIKNFTIGERGRRGGVNGLSIRSEEHRLMVWRDLRTGDTLEINLFNNSERPLPYKDIAEDNPQLVKELMRELNAFKINN